MGIKKNTRDNVSLFVWQATNTQNIKMPNNFAPTRIQLQGFN